MSLDQQQSRQANARLDLLRQDLIAPVLSIEGHLELLKEHIEDEDCLADLKRVETAANLTRELIGKMLAAESKNTREIGT